MKLFFQFQLDEWIYLLERGPEAVRTFTLLDPTLEQDTLFIQFRKTVDQQAKLQQRAEELQIRTKATMGQGEEEMEKIVESNLDFAAEYFYTKIFSKGDVGKMVRQDEREKQKQSKKK